MCAASTIAPITLARLLNDSSLRSLDGVSWSELQLDSRCLQAGDIFVALPGAVVDGGAFIDDCIEKNAAAILADAKSAGQEVGVLYRKSVPVVYVENLSKKLSAIAGNAWGNPSHTLDVVGITGTNGKTTCAILTAQLLALLGLSTAVIGTLGYTQIKAGAVWLTTGNTTPNAIAVQKILNEFVSESVKSVVMEVSSHGIEQSRVAGVHFTTAVFTNLSHDHLDAHGTLENYGAIKARLLNMDALQHAVINYDDQWARTLIAKATHIKAVLTYSVSSSDADVYLSDLNYTESHIAGAVHTPQGKGAFNLNLIGEFNASNALAAISVALLRGFELKQILPLLNKLQAPKGRMQIVSCDADQDIQVVIDYAHTPDALEKALGVLRSGKQGKLWCVFGCGGDRDKDKRSLMGAIAEKYSDVVVLTQDNPRHEDSNVIIKNILGGMKAPENAMVIKKREEAIEQAIQKAVGGDTILIAGKGHEDYQIVNGQRIDFSDEAFAKSALLTRAKIATGGLL